MPDVVVIGGGLAGLSAAFHLSQQGLRVLVLERDRVPGGRARRVASMGPNRDEFLDMGQHLLMGAYHEFLALARRLGTSSLLRPLRGPVPFLSDPGTPFHHRLAPLPPPLHLLPALVGLRQIPLRDRLLGLSRIALEAAASSRLGVPDLDGLTASAWLKRRGIAQETVHGFLGPLVSATVNLPPEEASAAMLAVVLDRAMLASRQDATPIRTDLPLHDVLVQPLVDAIVARGGEVRLGTRVEALEDASGSAAPRVRTSRGDSIAARWVVLAVPAWEVGALVQDLPSLSHLAVSAQRLGHSPIVTAEVFVDRPVLPWPMAALPGSRWHFVFRHPVRPGGAARQRISLVASHAADLMGRPAPELAREAWDDLAARLPEAAAAEPVHLQAIQVARATFRAAPGQRALRPAARSGHPRVVLSGDWTATGLPATLEGALRSGRAAAAEVRQGESGAARDQAKRGAA